MNPLALAAVFGALAAGPPMPGGGGRLLRGLEPEPEPGPDDPTPRRLRARLPATAEDERRLKAAEERRERRAAKHRGGK